jgi:hypothetical protein
MDPTIAFIQQRIDAMDKMLDVKNPLKQATRLYIWDEREWWKDMLRKKLLTSPKSA